MQPLLHRLRCPRASFGPGVGVQLATALAREGRVVEVDPSATMLNMARDRNSEALQEGRVELCPGTADKLSFEDATFDVAFTINSLHLWPDRTGVAVSRFSYASADKFRDHLGDAGFEEILVHHGDMGTCVVGRA